MTGDWYNLFNSTRMLFFLAGFGAATFWHWYKLRQRNLTLDLTPLGILIGVSIIIFTAIQQVGLAAEVKQCQAEFNLILSERARLSDQSDTLASDEIEANSHWLLVLTSPPPDIAPLPTSDPKRQAWGIQITKEYLSHITKIRAQREQSLEERKEKLYPAPTCGK